MKKCTKQLVYILNWLGNSNIYKISMITIKLYENHNCIASISLIILFRWFYQY